MESVGSRGAGRHFPVVFFFSFFSGELLVGHVESLKMKMHPENDAISEKSSSDLPHFSQGYVFFFRSGIHLANELMK